MTSDHFSRPPVLLPLPGLLGGPLSLLLFIPAFLPWQSLLRTGDRDFASRQTSRPLFYSKPYTPARSKNQSSSDGCPKRRHPASTPGAYMPSASNTVPQTSTQLTPDLRLLKSHLLSKAILATVCETPTPAHSTPHFIPHPLTLTPAFFLSRSTNHIICCTIHSRVYCPSLPTRAQVS